jgi:hypothetical protein
VRVEAIDKATAAAIVVRHHYLHRAPVQSFAYGLIDDNGDVVGVCTFGVPASRNVQTGACPSDPGLVIELNRLWVSDSLPRNSESWFVSRVLKMMPPRIVVSYADTSAGHAGYVYRALNFCYAGWTDMERKTPRFDYVVPGKHSREAFRGGVAQYTERVRRRPKVKYWTVSGDHRQRARLGKMMCWSRLDWKTLPPPVPALTQELEAA